METHTFFSLSRRYIWWDDWITYTMVTILQWYSGTNYLIQTPQIKSIISNKSPNSDGTWTFDQLAANARVFITLSGFMILLTDSQTQQNVVHMALGQRILIGTSQMKGYWVTTGCPCPLLGSDNLEVSLEGFCLFVCLFLEGVFWDRASLCNPGHPGTLIL